MTDLTLNKVRRKLIMWLAGDRLYILNAVIDASKDQAIVGFSRGMNAVVTPRFRDDAGLVANCMLTYGRIGLE